MNILRFYAYTNLFNFAVSLAIALLAMAYSKNRPVNKIFALLATAVGIWSFGLFNHTLSNNPESAMFWSKFLHTAAIFIPALYLNFILELLNRRNYVTIGVSYSVCLILVILLNFTNLFIREVSPIIKFSYFPKGGLVYSFYILFYFSCVVYGCYLIIRDAPILSGIKKLQLKYVLLSSIIGFTGGATTFLPIYNIPIFPYGNFFTFLYTMVLAYAILQYRLLDIEVVIKRGFVYSVLIASITAVYALGVFVATQLFQRFGISPWLLAILGAVAVAVGFKPLENFITEHTDRIFFRKKYEYRKTLIDLSKAMAYPTTLDELLPLIARIVNWKMRVTGTSILVLDEKRKRFVIRVAEGKAEDLKDMTISDNYGIIRELVQKDKILILDEIKYILTSQTLSEAEYQRLEQLRDEMVKLKSAVLVPCALRAKRAKKLIGVLSLGEKLSGDAFSTEDIELFTALSNQAATAISYALFMEETLQKEKLTALGTIVAGVAHEIKNPLTAIKSITQILPQKLTDKDWLDKYVNQLLTTEVGRLEELAASLLDYGKPREMQFKAENLNELLERVRALATMQIKAQDKSIILSLEAAEVPSVNIDASRITQALMGLISNAIQAIPKTGEIKLSAKLAGKEVAISIADTGVGISKEDLSKIFDPFFSTKEKGTGLGLSIIYKIIEQHKGRIEVESEVGKGTTFTIFLLASVPAPPSSK